MNDDIPTGERIDVTAETVAALVAEQFPQFAHLQVRLVRQSGWDNHTFHLGDRHKVRLPASAVYLSQTDKETVWIPRLAPQLPCLVPQPIAVGRPGPGYPFAWSIWEWIDGVPAERSAISDLGQFAEDLAGFLLALAGGETAGAPLAGPDNFFRGGDLGVYDQQARQCLRQLNGIVDTVRLTEVWHAALASRWQAAPVWVHGDIAWGNLLVRDGKLHAVIDFGSSAVGDPACDLVINWTLFDAGARSRFRAAYDIDHQTWQRARGWCIWKAMLIIADNLQDAAVVERERAVLKQVMDDLDESRS